MKAKVRLSVTAILMFLLLVLPIAAYGGVPEVSHVMVTDVTTTSFSVIWAASEQSTADLEVYEDADGSVTADDAIITPHPIESGDVTIRTAAEDNGVMKVRVTNLVPDTTYYFMTVTTSSTDTTYNPSAPPFTPVTTESETVRTYESGVDILPFSNDLIIEACYLDDGTTPAEGTLLLATVAGGSHPITAFVGDGVDPPYAIIDLNNVFSRDTYENLDLSQGLNLTLLNFRGLAGNSIVTHLVPEDQSLSEVKPAEFRLKAGWNMVSFQLEPGDTYVETVLEAIWASFHSLWTLDANGQWISYTKGLPGFMNDFEECHSHMGYWLVMNEEPISALVINGNFTDDPMQLHAGWNLVGYRAIETVNITEAIAPIADELTVAWTYTKDGWLSYTPGLPPFMNDIVYVKPGQGYMLYMNAACEW